MKDVQRHVINRARPIAGGSRAEHSGKHHYLHLPHLEIT